MAIVNLDKVLSGANGNLESVMVYGADHKQVENFSNGLFVTLKEYIETYNPTDAGTIRTGEVRASELSADGKGEVLMVHAPEMSYDEKDYMRDVKHEAGKVVRAYRLAQGDIISVTDPVLGITAHDEISVGDIVGITNGKLAKTDAVISGALSFLVTADAHYEVDSVEQAWVLQVQ